MKKITKCFDIFIKTEKKWPSGEIPECVDKLALVLARIHSDLVFQIVEDIYKSEVNESPSLKEFPNCLKLFRDLCRRCLGHDDPTVLGYAFPSHVRFHYEMLLEIFFWMDDEAALMAMCHKLCRDPGHPDLKDMVKSSEIQRLASLTPHGRVAYSQLLDCRIKQLRAGIYPVLSWSLPEASLPDYPDIERFLRSPLQEMEYGDFQKPEVDWNKLCNLLTSYESFDLTVYFSGGLPDDFDDHLYMCISKTVQRIELPHDEKRRNSLKEELTWIIRLRRKFDEMNLAEI